MRKDQGITVKSSEMVKFYLLSPFIKLLLGVALFVFLSAAGIFLLKQQSVAELQKAESKKNILQKEVSQQAQDYGELTYLSKNKDVAKLQYENVVKKFPPESKVGDLLADITKIGTAEGLKFVYFKPQKTVDSVYYAAVPVDISVVGKFHQIGLFLSGIANLPGSVVAVNQFTLERADKDNKVDQKNDLLSLQFTATLYHTLPTSLDIKV